MPMEISKIVKELYRDKGQTISEISKTLGYDRKTVRKYVNGGEHGYHRKGGYQRPLQDKIKVLMEAWYVEDLKGPRKQRRTGQKMHLDLVRHYEYKGCYTTVKKVLRGVKLKYKEVFVPREHKPGGGSEYDIGYAQIMLGGKTVEGVLHCHQLTYSNDIFVYVSLKENAQEVLLSHEKAFESFEGVPPEIGYDNLKQVVKAFLEGSRREEQAYFRDFRAGYGFESRFCEARKGWQKGDVEGCVGYVRRHFFSPVPEYRNLEELNAELSAWCKAIRSTRRVHGTTQTVQQRFEEERTLLKPMPLSKPVAGKRLICKVNHYSLITVEGVQYSVPTQYAYQMVDVVLLAHEVSVYIQTKCVATHKRSYDKHTQVFNPIHYLPVLLKKPYALVNSKPMTQLGPIIELFFTKAYQKGVNTARACAHILSLLETITLPELETALELAMAYETYHIEGIKNILAQLNTPQHTVSQLIFPQALKGLELNQVESVDLSRYDSLIEPNILVFEKEPILC